MSAKKQPQPVKKYIRPAAAIKTELPSVDKTIVTVLSGIRQLQPAEQNSVINTVLQELANDRKNAADAANDLKNRTTAELDQFFSISLK